MDLIGISDDAEIYEQGSCMPTVAGLHSTGQRRGVHSHVASDQTATCIVNTGTLKPV